MSKFIPVSREELIRRLKKLDFEGPYSGGEHLHMGRRITVIKMGRGVRFIPALEQGFLYPRASSL